MLTSDTLSSKHQRIECDYVESTKRNARKQISVIVVHIAAVRYQATPSRRDNALERDATRDAAESTKRTRDGTRDVANLQSALSVVSYAR